jgi:hypothetical protein
LFQLAQIVCQQAAHRCASSVTQRIAKHFDDRVVFGEVRGNEPTGVGACELGQQLRMTIGYAPRPEIGLAVDISGHFRCVVRVASGDGAFDQHVADIQVQLSELGFLFTRRALKIGEQVVAPGHAARERLRQRLGIDPGVVEQPTAARIEPRGEHIDLHPGLFDGRRIRNGNGSRGPELALQRLPRLIHRRAEGRHHQSEDRGADERRNELERAGRDDKARPQLHREAPIPGVEIIRRFVGEVPGGMRVLDQRPCEAIDLVARGPDDAVERCGEEIECRRDGVCALTPQDVAEACGKNLQVRNNQRALLRRLPELKIIGCRIEIGIEAAFDAMPLDDSVLVRLPIRRDLVRIGVSQLIRLAADEA